MLANIYFLNLKQISVSKAMCQQLLRAYACHISKNLCTISKCLVALLNNAFPDASRRKGECIFINIRSSGTLSFTVLETEVIIWTPIFGCFFFFHKWSIRYDCGGLWNTLTPYVNRFCQDCEKKSYETHMHGNK